MVHGFERPEHGDMKPLGVHISSCSGLSNPCTPRTHPVTITYLRFYVNLLELTHILLRSLYRIRVNKNTNDYRRDSLIVGFN